MSSVGIELVGGPADGRQIIIPGDLMNPPATYSAEVIDLLTGRVSSMECRRTPNPGGDGPLWLYRVTDRARHPDEEKRP